MTNEQKNIHMILLRLYSEAPREQKIHVEKAIKSLENERNIPLELLLRRCGNND